jgi:hypothetical protein
LHQGSQHGEEAAAGAGDRGAVGPVGVDAAVAVQEVGPRDAHPGEVQPAVVDPVEPALDTVVLTADAGQELPGFRVAEVHVERMDPMVDVPGDQLGEHHGAQAVDGGVADVVLPRCAEGRVHHELVSGGIERSGGGDAGHVGAVSGLGHGKAAGDLKAHNAGEPLGVVLGRAEVHHCGPEEPPLHACLDLQRRIRHHEFLKPRDVSAVVIGATQRLRERAVDRLVLYQVLQLAGHPGAVLGVRKPLDLVQFWTCRKGPGLAPDCGPLPQELFTQRVDVDGGLCFSCSGGSSCRCGARPSSCGTVH